MNNFILIAFLIPSLFLLPYLLTDEAYAYKLTDKEIKIEVQFYKTDNTDLPAMFSDFDSGLIEQNIFDVIDPVTVGQFALSDIVADWDIRINLDTGLHTLRINPKIIEVNIANGVPQPTIIDALVNDGRDQIRTWLTNYGITSYTWYLYYDGSTTPTIIDESNEDLDFSTGDNLHIRDAVRTTVDNPANIGTLTIVKNIITTGDGDAFHFTSNTLGEFDVVAITGSGSMTFTNLDIRVTYDVQEETKLGWTLDSYSCDNGQTIDNIILDGINPVTCTFTNIGG